MKDRSILVTGASGFLGSVILSHLRSLGARVTGASRSGEVSADLEDPRSIESLKSSGPFDSIVHCAAVLPGKRADSDVLNANLMMTNHVLEWATTENVRQFCFLSSCSIYGNATESCSEDTPPAPASVYGVSKLACEQMIRIAFPNASLLRVSAPYGPHLRLETVVKRFVSAASASQPIPLMGEGSREQHFVFEKDVAHAVSLALTNDAAGIFNISGDAPVSMRQLASKILRIFGRPEDSIHCSGSDPQEDYRGNFPHDAATKAFGYKPETELEEGLRECARAWGLL